MQRRKQAFTLIELLVVIAIIAILAAILFPVFAQAKLAAKKASDLSNFKQVSTAITVYLGDSDDNYMRLVQGNFNDWPVSTALWSSDQVLGPYTKNTDILKCPVDTFGHIMTAQEWNTNFGYDFPLTRKFAANSFMPNAITDFGGSTAWGIANPQGLMTVAGDFTGLSSGPTSASAVNQPSTVIMLANGQKEYYDTGYGCGAWLNTEIDYCYIFPGVYGDWLPIGIHLATPTGPTAFWAAMYKSWRKFNGGANYSFSDTHAKFMAPGVVDDPKYWLVNQ